MRTHKSRKHQLISLSVISEATSFLSESSSKPANVKAYLFGAPGFTEEQIDVFAEVFEKHSLKVSDADRVEALEEYDSLTFGDDDGKITPETKAAEIVTKKYPWFAKALEAAENEAGSVDDAPKSYNKDSVDLLFTAGSKIATLKFKLKDKKIDNAEKEHRIDGIIGDLLDVIDKLEKELK